MRDTWGKTEAPRRVHAPCRYRERRGRRGGVHEGAKGLENCACNWGVDSKNGLGHKKERHPPRVERVYGRQRDDHQSAESLHSEQWGIRGWTYGSYYRRLFSWEARTHRCQDYEPCGGARYHWHSA